MSFCIYGPIVTLCNNEKVIVRDIENNTETTILLPELQIDKKIDHHNNLEIETFHMITSVSFSNDGKYFLVCTNRKQLCLYEKDTLKLLSNRTLVRAASAVRFTSNNDIIVADKAGDAYLFSTSKPEECGKLLLGHLSMLLDILVSNNQKYIITTDRDEKIRVSMFPNSYNIVSYCLGHTKFVTNISELPHSKNVLVSAGGDGMLILWDYECGKALLSIDFHDRISDNDIKKFKKDLEEYHLDEAVEILPVKHMRLSALSSTSSLITLSFYNTSFLLVYKITGTMATGIEAEYLQSINVESEPVECILDERNLWLLAETGLDVYNFKDSNFVTHDSLKSRLKELNSYWEMLKGNLLKENLFPILYKRKFDNVQEYLDRKKMRLASVVE